MYSFLPVHCSVKAITSKSQVIGDDPSIPSLGLFTDYSNDMKVCS